MKTGDLVAILGCSGAGKTTLLAAISQRLRGNLTGDVVLNGVTMGRDDMTRISSFLPQFEISVKTFTAYEHLYFMVSTRIGDASDWRKAHCKLIASQIPVAIVVNLPNILFFYFLSLSQSHFKMHRKTTKAQKRQRVTDLLFACGLRDATHTRIQSLSGGERKRLSLAEEVWATIFHH